MDPRVDGARNLVEFVAAAVGAKAIVQRGDQGVFVASPVPIANGYVNAAVRTSATGDAGNFVDEAITFFAAARRPFVLWALDSDVALAEAAVERGGVSEGQLIPAMQTSALIRSDTTLHVSMVASTEEGAVFGALAERGYDKPGLARLLDVHGSYTAPGCQWVVAFDGLEPVGVGASFRHANSGGVYYIATPPESRGRGVGAAVTGWLTNQLLRDGVHGVSLQASPSGYPLYERLGFTTYDHYRRFTFDREPAR